MKTEKRYIAQCGEESDIFTTKEKAQDFFLNCPEDDCAMSHIIKEIDYKVTCEKCGCTTELLDNDFNPIDERPDHFADCSTLKDDEPNLD